MPNLNIVILAGNLTRDPELRYTAKGMAIGQFSIAINRKWRDEAGELQEEVGFFDCVAFGKTAENIAQYFSKGAPIMIQGRLKQETWEDKESGRARSKVKVMVEKFHFVAVQGKKDEEGAEHPPRKRAAAADPAKETEPVPDDSDSIPF